MDIHIKLTVDDRIVSVLRRARRVLSQRTLGLGLFVCAAGAAMVVMAAPVDRPKSFKAGDRITAKDINAAFDVIYDELNARVVRANETIKVANCAALKVALASLDDRRIVSNATVTIEVAEGKSACSSTIKIDHPDGGHIRIVGKGASKTTLTFFSTNGFVVPMSRSVGLIDKLTIVGGGGGAGDGVSVQAQATATIGTDVVVRAFQDGVHTDGGWVVAQSVISEDNTDDGFEAGQHGFIFAIEAISRDNAAHGFNSFLGSSIFADKALAQNNGLYGYNANSGSVIHAGNAPRATKSQHGFNANANSTIVTIDATVTDCDMAFSAWNDSYIEAQAPVSNTNDLGFTSRLGSYVHVTSPTGSSQTSNPSPNVWSDAEGNLLQVD